MDLNHLICTFHCLCRPCRRVLLAGLATSYSVILSKWKIRLSIRYSYSGMETWQTRGRIGRPFSPCYQCLINYLFLHFASWVLAWHRLYMYLFVMNFISSISSNSLFCKVTHLPCNNGCAPPICIFCFHDSGNQVHGS